MSNAVARWCVPASGHSALFGRTIGGEIEIDIIFHLPSFGFKGVVWKKGSVGQLFEGPGGDWSLYCMAWRFGLGKHLTRYYLVWIESRFKIFESEL